MSLGQLSHQVTSRLTIWSAGYKVRNVHPLEATEALKLGSELIGESFILGVSVAAVVWEYNRSKEKERKKEDAIQQTAQQERDALQEKLNSLDIRLHALEQVVQTNNESFLHYIQRKPKYIVPTDGIVPIDPTKATNNTTNTTTNSNNDDNEVDSAQRQQQGGGGWRRWLWPFG